MARKTKLSFIRGMIVAAATKRLMAELTQSGVVYDAGCTDIAGSKIKMMKAKHPPRTDIHKNAKKPITNGYVLNTARVRKKKRRDVNMTVVL